MLSMVLLFSLSSSWAAEATTPDHIDLALRGQHLFLPIYQPTSGERPKGTVIMGSGDVGWVGLAVTMARFLSENGYEVVGLNVREYLSAFTTRGDHVKPEQVQQDFCYLASELRAQGLLNEPVIVSGVSEGAALAVLAGSFATNHAWISGVITMGLPPTAELAWRWSDFPSWITKKDSAEPSFAPKDYIAAIAPRPIWMIQSTHDEYVTEADYRQFEATARPPKHLVLISASNHRFTDRLAELKVTYLAALARIAACNTSECRLD